VSIKGDVDFPTSLLIRMKIWYCVSCTTILVFSIFITCKGYYLIARVTVAFKEIQWSIYFIATLKVNLIVGVITAFSKIQLVVYYQCCSLIVWPTTRLLYYRHNSPIVAISVPHICYVLVAKKDSSLALTSERSFVSIFFDQLVGFY